MHHIGDRDRLIGPDNGGIHPGLAAFPALPVIGDVLFLEELEDHAGIGILEEVAEGGGEFVALPPADLAIGGAQGILGHRGKVETPLDNLVDELAPRGFVGRPR